MGIRLAVRGNPSEFPTPEGHWITPCVSGNGTSRRASGERVNEFAGIPLEVAPPPNYTSPRTYKVTICAVVESRSRETCIAKMELRDNTLLSVFLTQDNSTYTDTLDLLVCQKPDVVLVHSSACNASSKSLLTRKIEKIREANRGVPEINPVSRCYFDQGARSINQSRSTHTRTHTRARTHTHLESPSFDSITLLRFCLLKTAAQLTSAK